MRTVTFRTLLKGTLSDFLAKECLHSLEIEEGLLDMVVSLSHYSEEGRLLFPQVVLCDELQTSLKHLQCGQPLQVGSGPATRDTMAVAVKRCAPLATGGWVVYIKCSPGLYEYGLFRKPASPTAIDIRDTLLSADPASAPHVMLAEPLAEKAVALIGARAKALNVYLSGAREDEPSQMEAIQALSRSCCATVSSALQEQTQSYLASVLLDSLRRCHGALIMVIAPDTGLESITPDGVFLASPPCLAEAVGAHEQRQTDDTLSALTASSALVSGMLNCDGILAFDSDCRVRGYNLFLQSVGAGRQGTPTGGARSRAFSQLRSFTESGRLLSCFIRSASGTSTYCGGSNP